MSAPKTKKKMDALAITAPPVTGSLWPDEFPSPRRTAVIAGVTGALCIAWLALGLNSALLPVKYIGAYLLGFYDFTDLGPTPGGFDLASVLTGFTLLVGGTLIHPACGLIVLAAIRPWLDGYTFPSDNVYFLWGTILIFVLWGVRALMRGEAVRTGPLVALLLALLLAQILTAFDSIQFAKSYRQLLLWANYFFLFLLVLNTLKSRRTIQLVLFGITVVAGLQAAFAILQYFYIFPYLRVLLNERPDLRWQFFGIADWTPELAHRFNTNRAFGTILFPNSFAAFVILLLPHVLVQTIQNFRAATADVPNTLTETARRYRALAVAVVAWFIATCGAFGVLQMPGTYAVGPLRGEALEGIWASTNSLLAASVAVGLVAALLLFVYTLRRGVPACGRLLYALCYLASAGALASALYLSFSRGGMLALAVAAAGGVLVYWTPESRLPRRLRATAAAALLALTAAAIAYQPDAVAQETRVAPSAVPAGTDAPGGRSTEVTEAGRGVDLAGTESFWLRFSYWRVAGRIFRDNIATGVGLGALEWAYPAYQEIGDGDVREAHNAYLQALAETGILGGALLMLFWAAVLCYAALRVVREKDRDERLLLAALFTGILAFLGHAFIDINFQHPSLMFFAFLMTGIFVARAKLGTPAAEKPGNLRTWLLLPALAVAALTVGMSMRVYTQDLCLSRMKFIAASKDKEIEHRYKVGEFFFGPVLEYGTRKITEQPSIPVRSARMLIRDLDELKLFGTFFIRNAQTPGARRLGAGEEITDDAILRIEKPWVAYHYARAAALRWLAELANIDARFPHDPQLANHIANWHSMMAERLIAIRHMQEKRESAAKQVRWIEEAIARSPMYADLYVAAASAYWMKGDLAQNDGDRQAAYAQAITHIEKAPALARALPQYEHLVAYAYQRLAKAYSAPENRDKQRKCLAKAKAHKERGDAIYRQRNELGLFTQAYGGPVADTPQPGKDTE